MNSYLTRLNALDYRHSLAAHSVRSRLVLLTGQSSFRTSRLSETQTDFLHAVAPPDTDILPSGFPYHFEFQRDAPEPNLLAASCRNGLQFVWSLWTPAFQQLVARALQPIFQNTRQSLYFITGSCGLQLLACAWPLLTKPKDLALRIVALGPTLLRPFTLDMRDVLAIQGRTDALSRWFYRGAVTAFCDAGHLDYWPSQATRELVARLLQARGNA